MGWPVDESYARNSNVTHVAKLTGKLMLVVGELDTNVDPASTAQVVSALQKADKDFDFLLVMNANHGAAETPYGKRRRAEFLVRNLLPATPGRD
jgi:dipeptidyl-peptidase-4